ncbi:hypothetical protein I4U23_021987 [Adineta vaga]|nr:hypothetical protein I4U23_021987 [Adineta vaga]
MSFKFLKRVLHLFGNPLATDIDNILQAFLEVPYDNEDTSEKISPCDYEVADDSTDLLDEFNLYPNSLPGGWSLCYNGTYADNMNTGVVAIVLSSCNKAKLLLGCRPINNVNLTIAAMGSRSDVLYNCSSIANCTNIANGVGWYFSDSYSWGFIKGGDTATRGICDTGSTNAIYRLCWFTGGYVGGGYRCGASTGLNSDVNWERIIYHSN